MKNRTVARSLVSMGSLAAPFALYAAELATPRPPGLERLGQSGTNTACYWVAAANESNQLTDLSDPVSITNLPDALNERNKVLVRIQPVEGAQTYYVLKTEILQAPGSVRISARTSPALVAGDIRLDLFIPAIRSKAQRDEPSPQKSIHRRLSDTLKRQIDTWKGDAGSHVADDLKPVMVSNLLFEINALLLSRDFHETEAWREIHLDDEDRKAIENRTTLDAEALARLNRDLLDAAFPDSITKWKSKNPLGTYYYWIAARNTWRWSALAGPFVAKDVDITKGVRLEWQPVPNATFYDVYRKNEAAPPLGRDYHLLAHQLEKTELLDTADKTPSRQQACAFGVGGYPATSPLEAPAGRFNCLLGTTVELTLADTGQPLGGFLVPNVNATKRTAVTRAAEGHPDRRADGADLRMESTMSARDKVDAIKFGAGSGRSALSIHNQITGGGLSDRHDPPYGEAGGKSWLTGIGLWMQSETYSQHAALDAEIRGFGMGDHIGLGVTVKSFGAGNTDGGDEGQFIRRERLLRIPHQAGFTARGNAPRGSTRIKVGNRQDGIWGTAGAGRPIVNMSQAYSEGRIEWVDNVMVYGKDTKWTPEMVGHFISFDVDTFLGSQNDTRWPHRMFYQIAEVINPTSMQIRAKVGWGETVNLGYSRFIFDPETKQGPGKWGKGKPPNEQPDDLSYAWPFVRAKEESASQGKYVIVPGTRLDDPWWQDPDVLHVEPLREDWRAEDQLLVPMAPGFFQLANIMYYRGDFSPQDEVRGVSIANGNPQTIPSPAIDIGIAPYWGGFGEGLRMTLPDSGLGDGLHIKGSRVRTACIRVPADMPALRFDAEGGRSLADIPYVEGNTRANAFEFNSARGGRTNTILSVTPDSLRLGNDTAVKGSARTRGKAVFSGDGKTRTFTVRFSVPFAEDAPCIVFTDNQFARSRLANTTRTAFSVEFDDAPPEGKTNVLINWMAQE